jgi:hypothetical protein
MLKVFLDDFTNANVENVALMLEGCGRFLLRTDETRERMATMVHLPSKKASSGRMTYYFSAGTDETEAKFTDI